MFNMHLKVWNTVELLEPLFISSESPKKVFESANVQAKDGLWFSHSRYVEHYPVWQAAQQDGFEACVAQQMWGLMNPARSRAASAWAFEVFREQQVLKKVEGWLEGWAGQFSSSVKLEVFVVPADPANRNLMLRCNGLSVAGLAGCLTASLWPSMGNLRRLEAALARAFVYSLRQQHHPARTLADYLVMEGLASVFAGQVQFHRTPWLIPFLKPEDWQDELGRVAQFHSVEHYEDIPANIYGNVVSGEYAMEIGPLEAEEIEYAVSLVPLTLETTDTNAIAAYLYGDQAVLPQGHPGVGMVALGGIEVAYWMLQNYFARNPHDFRFAIGQPAREIIWEAGYLT